MTGMLRFENQGNFFELDLTRQEVDELPSKGDAYVTVRVSSAGFVGHNDLWVACGSLREFCASLIALERDRRGKAEIHSMSPNELLLTVRSADSRGHMLVEGATGYHVLQREGATLWHAVQFGFEFEPSQLVAATSVAWVKENAERIC